MNTASQHRIHAIDHLRAHMMLLGIVFHASFAFTTADLHLDLPYSAETTNPFFSTLIGVIHIFRMPVFFIVAGFFTCLLISRRGVYPMLKDRGRRILIPLIMFWPILYYLSETGSMFANAIGENRLFDSSTLSDWSLLVNNVNLVHLWFLYMLVMFYVVAALATRFVGLSRMQRMAGLLWQKHVIVIVIGVLSAPIFWIHPNYSVPAPFSFIPDPSIYLYYFCFFVAGFLLFLDKKALEMIKSNSQYWLGCFIIFLLLHAATGLLVLSEEALKNFTTNWYSGVFKAFATCAASLLIISWYLRLANSFSKTARYISESSYWLYLIHFPLTAWIPPLMHGTVLPIELRFLITIFMIVAIGILSYEVFVRRTFIGALLNGKRMGAKA